jgi:Na+/H+ antiporter NhaD/arsenite permease-like protein
MKPFRDSEGRVAIGLVLLLIAYIGAVLAGWPQQLTAKTLAQYSDAPKGLQKTFADNEHSEALPSELTAARPSFWMILPFGLLLLAIAVFPLLPVVAHWWDSNSHKFWIAAGLGLVSLLYYLTAYRQPVTGHWPYEYLAHPTTTGFNWHVAGAVFSNAILGEYVPFIILLFSLYTITGGIRVEGDLPAHPLTNTVFLGIGALLASLIGTTGASMLLIRPLLETNRERTHVQHTVIVFIFIVCNCGGCLLPLGDPPLFLGYLFGVPFFWPLKLWPAWLLVNGLLLTIYFLWDHFWHYPREKLQDIQRDEREIRPLQFRGLWPNVLLLIGVILSVALLDPGKSFPGLEWRPWIYLREAVQLGLVACSLWSEPNVRRDNHFNFGAILEVAGLFLGIFLCMHAPLQILHICGPSLGLTTPTHFFWASGSLSSFLDNAPTYAVYFETARSLGGDPRVAGVQESLLAAISLGAVFMGSMTYIGNGPNFMVKSIAEKAGVKMPSFFGYIAYSVAILLPLFFLVTLMCIK